MPVEMFSLLVLASACAHAGQPELEEFKAAIMETIEARVIMPDKAWPLNEYARSYEFSTKGTISATYVHVKNPGLRKRQWVERAYYPKTSASECSVVSVQFDVTKYEVRSHCLIEPYVD